jgi:PKD repeat protein
MKILLPQSLLFLACWLLAAGCQKTETITLDQPKACFSSTVFDPYNGTAVTNTTALIDSSFRFINCSDSGSGISYRWDFGDGATSTEKNPVHRYPRRGQYPVTLIVSRDNRAFDTISKMHNVILGQQHVSFGETTGRQFFTAKQYRL